MFQLLDRLVRRYADWRYEQEMKAFQTEFEEMKIEDIKLGKTELTATIIHSGVAEIAGQFAQLLIDGNCKNYLQFILYPMLERGIRPVEVTLRWYNGGKTPAQKATELETKLKCAEGILREYANKENWKSNAVVPMNTGKSMFEDDEVDVEFEMGEDRIWDGDQEGFELAQSYFDGPPYD